MSLVITVRFDQTSLNAALRRLDPSAWKRRASAGVREGTLYLERAIAQRMRKKTGAAAASVLHRMVSVLEGHVTSSLDYVAILETGSRPHVIRPARAKVLAFPGGSGTVFTRFVRHPGTKGYHTFRDTTVASVRAVTAIVARHLGAAA